MTSRIKYFFLALGLCVTATTYAEPLGRLFFTPEQRTQLDNSLLQNIAPENNDRTLTVNGIVQKDGGKRTAWINGVPQQVGQSDADSPATVPVEVPGISKPIKIKVGQRVLINPAAGSQE